jgi:hypothetical protein
MAFLELLLKYGADPIGYNELLTAVKFQDLEFIQLPLKHKADPNKYYGDMGRVQPTQKPRGFLGMVRFQPVFHVAVQLLIQFGTSSVLLRPIRGSRPSIDRAVP